MYLCSWSEKEKNTQKSNGKAWMKWGEGSAFTNTVMISKWQGRVSIPPIPTWFIRTRTLIYADLLKGTNSVVSKLCVAMGKYWIMTMISKIPSKLVNLPILAICRLPNWPFPGPDEILLLIRDLPLLDTVQVSQLYLWCFTHQLLTYINR